MKKSHIQLAWKSKFSECSGNPRDKHRSNYLHFDVKPDLTSACKKIFKPSYIKKHSFWPFIFYKAKAEKIKLLSELLSKHSLALPPSLNNKKHLPKNIKGIIDSDPEISKALISTKGNPHKYATWKLRPICYASHFDSLIYSYYSELLSYDYEKLLAVKNLDENVLAFRKSQSRSKVCNIDHSYKAFGDIKNYEKCIVLAFDVSSFFDILDHKILKNKWLQVVQQSSNVDRLPDEHFSVFKSITSYSYVDRDEVYDLFKISKNNPKNVSRSVKKEIEFNTLPETKHPITKNNCRIRLCSGDAFRKLSKNKELKIKKNLEGRGIPQGSPMSGLLSNIYMIDFDIKLKDYTESLNGKYYRYCDDLLCILPINEHAEIIKTASELEGFVYKLASNSKLDVNKKKTEKYAFMPDNTLQAIYPDKKANAPEKLTTRVACARISGSELIYSRLQYLGFKFDGEKITIRSSSISRYQKKLKRGIKYHLQLKRKYDPTGNLKRQKLRKLYSHVGESNFPIYAYRSAKVMKSPAIRKQLNKHQKEINFQIKTISKRIKIAP
ncbi:reverse transcriptase domain-containing protein [Vibrio splendidus]